MERGREGGSTGGRKQHPSSDRRERGGERKRNTRTEIKQRREKGRLMVSTEKETKEGKRGTDTDKQTGGETGKRRL